MIAHILGARAGSIALSQKLAEVLPVNPTWRAFPRLRPDPKKT
jgi:hypothetical protein